MKIIKEETSDLAKLAIAVGSLYVAKKILDMKKRNKYRPGDHSEEEAEARDYQNAID